MIGLRKRGLAITSVAVLTAGIFGVAPATTATAATGVPFSQAQFKAYGTGSELELSALNTPGGTQLARVDQAFSGNTAASNGLPDPVVSPITGAVVQPAFSNAINATGRGSGLEVGLGLNAAQANQIQLGIAEAKSPPPNAVGTLAGPDVSVIPLNLAGLLQTGVLHGFAATAFNNTFCPVGQPLAFGLGSAAAPTTVLNTVVSSPGVAQSATRTDLVANADGTFGLATTVAEQIAPLLVTLLPGALPTTLEVDVQGTGPTSPVSLTAFTDGQGHSVMSLGNADPTVTIKLVLLGIPVPPITASLSALAPLINTLLGPSSALSGILGAAGLGLSVTLGDGKTVNSPLPGFTNSTNTISGSYDLLALHLGAGPTTLVDLRLGHMEAAVTLPTGAISCIIPVSKIATPPSVSAGNSFTWSISIPSDAAALSASACDLTHIAATDKIGINSGKPTFTVTSVSNGGVYNATTQTITWANLGNYHPGDPPIVLTVTVAIPADSPAGVLQDTVNVAAGLGNCTGGASGQASLIGANIGNVVTTGSITLIAPQVTAGNGGKNLAATGNGPLLAWAGALLLVMAEGTRRILRRARPEHLS